MTNVHRRSTLHLIRVGVAGAVVALMLAVPTPGAHGYTITETKNKIARLSAELARSEARSGALAQQYDSIAGQVQALDGRIHHLRVRINRKRARIAVISRALTKSLVRDYVDGSGSDQGIPLFNQNVTQSDARQVYVNEALGNLNQLEANLVSQTNALNRLVAHESTLRSQQAAAAHETHTLLAENLANEAATRYTLSRVTHALSGQIIAYEMTAAVAAARRHDTKGVESAIAAASAVGGQTAANAIIAAVAAVTVSTVTGSPSGSKGGLAAVAAAKGQIGVPYVWGGETPGSGFDCSGLTQWAWKRAGVYIPRTAAQQYYSMPHVLLTDLRPGDLLFYYNLDGDNQVDHVVMYVGSGPWGINTIIAASHTGTLISLEPLFTYGLIGAGRP